MHRLEDLVVVVEPLLIQVLLEYRDKEILAAPEVQHQQQRLMQQVVEVVLEELEELELLMEQVVLVELGYQHFKEILEFQLLMEHLDHNQEDILLVVEEEQQTQYLLAQEDLVEVEKELLDLYLEQQILVVVEGEVRQPTGLVLLVVQEL
jgi:hypothetical protein